MSLHHKAHETSHDTRRSKVQKKQKETQKVVKPWTPLSEDAVVVKYYSGSQHCGLIPGSEIS